MTGSLKAGKAECVGIIGISQSPPGCGAGEKSKVQMNF